MDVVAILERLFQRRNIGDMGQNAQLNLAVIQRHDLLAGFRHESLPDPPPLITPHRDILQVGVGRGQPPGDRPGDGIAGVNPPGIGVDMILQGVGIGRFQLGQLPPVEHPSRQFMFGGQILQNIGTRRIGPGLALFTAGQGHLVEQYLAQLLG